MADDPAHQAGRILIGKSDTYQYLSLSLANRGAASFFGEPDLDINDLLRIGHDGRGAVNILSAGKLMRGPNLCAVFLLWMLSELFEKLAEVEDLDHPTAGFLFRRSALGRCRKVRAGSRR